MPRTRKSASTKPKTPASGTSRVTALTTVQRDPSLVRISIDGAPVGSLLRATVDRLKLAVDGLVSESQAARIRRAVLVANARSRGLRMLSTSDRSSRRLEELLVDRGHDPEAAREAIAGLRADGWVDDARFAESRARTLIERSKLSHAAVAEALEREGLPSPVAKKAATRAAPAPEDLHRAIQLAKDLVTKWIQASPKRTSAGGGRRSDPKVARRVASGLARAGFEPDTIATALDRAGIRIDQEGDL